VSTQTDLVDVEAEAWKAYQAAQALALDRYVSVQRLGALRADALAAHDRAVDAAWSRYCRSVDAWLGEQGIGGPLEEEVGR